MRWEVLIRQNEPLGMGGLIATDWSGIEIVGSPEGIIQFSVVKSELRRFDTRHHFSEAIPYSKRPALFPEKVKPCHAKPIMAVNKIQRPGFVRRHQ